MKLEPLRSYMVYLVILFMMVLTLESAFTPKWCFGVMTMWLVGLMTGVKDLSQVIRSLVASTDAVVPSLTKKKKTACFWTRKFFFRLLLSRRHAALLRGVSVNL